jgi:GAF domain-containing protein
MFGNARRFIKAAVCSPYTTRIFLPLCASLPAATFAASDIPGAIPKVFWDWVREFNRVHPGVRTFTVFTPAFLIALAYGLEKAREHYEKAEKLVEEELSRLLRILEKPVGRKRHSFGELAHRHVNDGSSLDLHQILLTADPLEQIRSLVEGIHVAFQADVKRHDELRVTLARMDHDVIQGFECYLPAKAGPRSFTQLQGEDCTFNVAARERTIIIVPDLKKELQKSKRDRRYSAGKAGGPHVGSLICYPVIHQELDIVPYVIGVKYSDANHFTPARQRRYEFLLSQFAERIALEFSLKKLSEAKNNRDQT